MLIDETPVYGSVKEHRPLALKIVNGTDLELLWDDLVRTHHFLGFGKMIGQSIKYLVFTGERPIAALSYNRAALHVEARDAYIGWTDEGRKLHLSNVICNHRFLIFPWIRVKNLASHVLAQSLRSIRIDWKRIHGVEPQIVETFIDSDRYPGTCYLAANFQLIGETKGYGKRGKIFEYHGKKKNVMLYELNKGFIKSISPHLRRTVRPDYPEKPKKPVNDQMLYGFPVWSPSILSDVGIAYENADLLNKLFDGYIVEYKHCFNHKAQEVHFRLYLRGLLSDLERKSVEPIALMYGGESAVRTLQIFVKSSVLSDDLLLDQYNRMLSEAVSDDDGMLTVDGCDFVKRGTHSVGVSRQHCGPLGKTDSCQASVMIGYSGKEGYGLIDRRLYMPEKWMSDEYAEMRKKCEVPEDIKFQTKNQIAIELLTSAYNSGIFKAKWVGADSAFGHDTKFLDAIPKELFYVANVHADDMFYVKMPKIQSPKWYGIGRKPIRPIINEKPSKVRDIIEKSKIKWETVEFGYGSKGMIIGQEMALRVADIRNGLPNKLVWLYARKWDDGRVKYLISNAPEDTSIEKLRELSLRRWAIEQCFEECKSCLGMDHYEGRSWKGWHRHVLFVFIAHLLLLLIRKKFSVEFHQLSEHGKKIFKDKKRNNGIGTKVAFLTTSMARDVCNLFFLKDKSFFRHAINKINYTIKRYAMSFISFCKRQKNRVLSSFP